MMIKIIPLLVTLVFTLTTSAQKNTQAYNVKTNSLKVKKVIETFFEGFHKGDSIIVSTTLYRDIKIQTTATNKLGENILTTDTKEKLLTSVANKKPEQTYFEKLLSFDIKIDGNLASVWTPYEFYLNGNFSHCGANSFQLFNNNGKWEIIFLVDMRRRDNCNALKEKK